LILRLGLPASGFVLLCLLRSGCLSARAKVPGPRMKIRLLHLLLAVLCSTPVLAQGANRISDFLRTALVQRSKQIIAAAAEMPADKYNFKGPPDDLTFGYLTLHVADVNYVYCSIIGGVSAPQLPQLSETDAKDMLLQRMKSSFEFCTATFANLDDSAMKETLDFFGTKLPRSMAILSLTSTWTTHRELEEKYLQLNGYPTSSAPD
jgi:hypothetical protein